MIEHRVFIGPGGQPVTVEAAIEQRDELPDYDPDKERRDAINRAFWDRLIANIRFSHPDQAPPRHGGRNWVRVPMPDPHRTASGVIAVSTSSAGHRPRSTQRPMHSSRFSAAVWRRER